MSRTRILVVAAALLAAAVLITPAEAASNRAAAAPVVGRCYNLTYAQAGAASSSVHYVACSSTHTTKTVAVPTVPSGTDYKNISDAAAVKLGVTLCQPKFFKYLGSTPENRHLTAYDYLFFIPTAAQRAAGARWMRCDLLLAGGKAVLPLPPASNSTPVLTGPITDSIKRCLVGTEHLRTTCDHNHQYRSSSAYTLPGTGYRTPSQFTAAGAQRCPDAEYFTWPSKNGWTAGDHVLVCFDKTTG